jgi:hypothetical protein
VAGPKMSSPSGCVECGDDRATGLGATMHAIESWIPYYSIYGWKLILGAASTFSIAWLIQRVIQLRSALAGVGNVPGYRHVIGPFGILGRLIPFEIPYFNRKRDIHARAKRVGKYLSLVLGVWFG